MANYNSINDYLEAKEKWEAEHTTIVNGEFEINGKRISATEYYCTNPKPVYSPLPRENPDGTNLFGGVITERR